MSEALAGLTKRICNKLNNLKKTLKRVEEGREHCV
jgi:hypothetical protein